MALALHNSKYRVERCSRCGLEEHRNQACQNRPICYMCGIERHDPDSCEAVVCGQCFGRGHTMKACIGPKKPERCHRCGSTDHRLWFCPRAVRPISNGCHNCGSSEHGVVACQEQSITGFVAQQVSELSRCMELQWTDGGLKADDIPSAKKRKTAEHHGPDEYHRFEESPSLVLPRESIDSVAWLANVPQSSSVSVSQEAEELLQYLKPTPAESKAREDLLLRLTLLVQELFPWSQLQVFGSTQTDLLLPLSDLDVIIAHVIENMSNVDQLILKIDTSGIAVPGTIRVVPARVKLVQFQDAATWIKVDMSFNQVAGISSGNVLNISLDAIKPARPLMLLVKYLLASHGLSEPFTGGLGSHPLAIIVLSFLKNAAACVDGAPEEDLGLLFLDFLSFYGQIFNWYLAGISIDGFFPKREKKHFEFGGKLWRPFVEDCIPPYSHVSFSFSRLLEMRLLFQQCVASISCSPANCPGKSFLARILSVDTAQIEHLRNHLREYCQTLTTSTTGTCLSALYNEESVGPKGLLDYDDE